MFDLLGQYYIVPAIADNSLSSQVTWVGRTRTFTHPVLKSTTELTSAGLNSKQLDQLTILNAIKENLPDVSEAKQYYEAVLCKEKRRCGRTDTVTTL